MNGAKNYALLNTDELCNRRGAFRIPRVPVFLNEFLESGISVLDVTALRLVRIFVIDRSRDRCLTKTPWFYAVLREERFVS